MGEKEGEASREKWEVGRHFILLASDKNAENMDDQTFRCPPCVNLEEHLAGTVDRRWRTCASEMGLMRQARLLAVKAKLISTKRKVAQEVIVDT